MKAQAEISSLKKANSGKVEEMLSKNQELQSQLEDITKQYTQEHQNFATSQEQFQAINKALLAAQERESASNSRQESTLQDLREARETISNLQKSVQTIRQLEKEVATYSEKEAVLSSQLDVDKSQREELRAEINLLSESLEKERLEHTKAQNFIKQYQIEIQNEKEQHRITSDQLAAQTAALQTQDENIRSQVAFWETIKPDFEREQELHRQTRMTAELMTAERNVHFLFYFHAIFLYLMHIRVETFFSNSFYVQTIFLRLLKNR